MASWAGCNRPSARPWSATAPNAAAAVIVRQHRRTLPCLVLGRLQRCGETKTGVVYEQPVQATDPATGACLPLRRIEVRLLTKTRDGERTIAVLTNLPADVAAVD